GKKKEGNAARYVTRSQAVKYLQVPLKVFRNRILCIFYRDKANPFGDSTKCTQDGNAYISFGQWVRAIDLYIYVFWMLAPPSGGFDVVDSSRPIKAAPKSSGSPPKKFLCSHTSLKRHMKIPLKMERCEHIPREDKTRVPISSYKLSTLNSASNIVLEGN
ncbi:PIN-LIKES 6-like protein, partial [Tanacetum coccineum]